ncbi:MAG: glycosyltransferase family 2 protein [Synergistaceae bacterium]|jgi:glycosyltransferase involved in cell wall biosynthesis|nr:glycosyltransferase family 2 protein [Synergistaceae bacterium]
MNKIAVLLAVYNGAKFLEEQLKSLLTQTCQDFKIYIHDDGSSDSSMYIVGNYQKKNPYKFIIIDDNKQFRSSSENFFHLLKIPREAYIALCDQDDIWVSDKIEKMLRKIEEEEKRIGQNFPILAFSDLIVVDEKLNLISESYANYQKRKGHNTKINQLLIANVVTGCACMFNQALREKAVLCKNTENVVMHDWWLAIVATLFGSLVYLNEGLVYYRQHSNNRIGARNKLSLRYIFQKFCCIKNALKSTRVQATEIMDTYGEILNPCVKKLIYEYSLLGNKSKIERLNFYYKYKIFKPSFIENIGLFLVG